MRLFRCSTPETSEWYVDTPLEPGHDISGIAEDGRTPSFRELTDVATRVVAPIRPDWTFGRRV